MGKEPFRWKFVEIKPNLVRGECLEGPGTASGTTVTFRLSDTGDGRTVVECDRSRGLAGEARAFHICNTFWGMLMDHLREYAETTKPAAAFSQ
jgi:hypothetical protein